MTKGDENLKKKSSDNNCDSPGDSDTETLDVTIDLEDDDATVEREAGDSDDRDTVKNFGSKSNSRANPVRGIKS